jgi:hypothetical protein
MLSPENLTETPNRAGDATSVLSSIQTKNIAVRPNPFEADVRHLVSCVHPFYNGVSADWQFTDSMYNLVLIRDMIK